MTENKPEPLKNKEFRVGSATTNLGTAFFKEDVQRAIEWFKKEFIKEFGKPKDEPHSEKVFELIEKSVPDLFKEEK